MSELRRDPIIGRWNIVETADPSGPDAFDPEPHELTGTARCPFCAGNESMTPPEIHAVRTAGSAANGPGWSLRVVPNKFPALKVEGDLRRRGLGVYDLSNGVGAHEVIIESPDHARQMADLTLPELSAVAEAFKARSLDLRGDRRLKYALIFKNYGLSAGATLDHSHCQLIALPVVPKRVQEELAGAERYYEFRERCAYCDMLSQEQQEGERIVCENRSFVALCPFMAGFPFELWILPKEHRADFAGLAGDEIQDFSRILKEALARVRGGLSNPAYNFMLHTAPVDRQGSEAYHWHLELIPKLTRIAGFEWGTGFYINPTSPEFAAKILREAAI